MVPRNSANILCTFRIYVCLRLCDRDCCSAADGLGSYHAPALSYLKRWHVTDVKKIHWRWPGNPSGRSKFRNLCLFKFTRSQLTLRRRLMAASGDHSNGTLPTSKTSPAMTRIDRNSANTKNYAYEIKQSVFLLLRTTPRLPALRTIYFPAITRNGFCFHIRKIISRRPWPHRKNEIYIL